MLGKCQCMDALAQLYRTALIQRERGRQVLPVNLPNLVNISIDYFSLLALFLLDIIKFH